MANNCLVTKLKGTVENPELIHLNAIRIGFSNNTRITAIGSTENSYLEKVIAVKGSLDWPAAGITNVKEIVPSGTYHSIFIKAHGSEGALIDVLSKRNGNIEIITDTDLSNTLYLDTLHYSEGIKTIRAGITKSVGSLDLSKIDFSIMAYFEVRNGSKTVIPASMEFTAPLNSIQINDSLDGPNIIEANLSSFNKATSLSQILMRNSQSVVGSVNDLCDALYANGKTSGSLVLNINNTGCTYNGNPITSTITINFSNSGWSEA